MGIVISVRTMFLSAALVMALALRAAADDDCPEARIAELHDEARLHKDLFCAYQFYDYRPVKDYKTAVNVKVRFALKYISFDNLEETFTLHSWVAMTWKDEFLTWTPADYGDIKEIQVESHEFWTPRMSLFNADATMINSDDIYTTCLLKNDGVVTCVPHMTHSGICRTSLQMWPYDRQNCTLYFGSWMHTGEQVNFTFFNSQPIVMEDYQDGPGWKLEKTQHERLPGRYSSYNSTYPMLRYTFMLKRLAAGPAAIVVVPTVVIVLLTLISLFLDVKDNARLSLICFSLYGHFTFLTEVGYNIPKHSAETPIILLFLRDSMIITLVGILETLFLMSLRRRSEPAPTWVVTINRLVSSGPSKYIVFTEFEPSSSGEVKILSEEGPSATATSEQHSHDWIQLASLINSILSFIAVLTYAILIFTYIPTDSR